MVHLAVVDIALILAFFSVIVAVGFRARRRIDPSTTEFLLAGRTLTLPVFVATLVSTWYGGILGIGEFSYQYGLSNWIVFGMPYYVFALVFALLIAKRARATNLFTIPDKLFISYDKKTSLFGAVLTFILVSPAALALMLGILIRLIFGLSLEAGTMISTLVTVIYLFSGGFRSDVAVNIVEFVVMFVGFAIVLPFAYSMYGGVAFLQSHLPPLHLTWHGGNSMQYILVWFFIALWTLVDPSFHQRCYAAKDGATAQRGIFVSIGFWFLFDFLTSAAGLYARAILPDLKEPAFAYPMLAEAVLPPVAKGLFYIGMLATIMSTLSSYTFVAGVTFGNDIMGRLISFPDERERELGIRRWTKAGILLAGILAVVLALTMPSVVKLWYVIGTCIIPGLLVPVIASYFERLKITAAFAFASMCAGFFGSTAWLILGQVAHGVSFLGIEPMYPGLILSMLIWGMGRIHSVSQRRIALRGIEQ
ncbi:MAG TPA: sodium:solute symporter family protein [Bacteroidota bacterium]|nr:sodium:solute symporter family protein [Bacteroidota bacterium]